MKVIQIEGGSATVRDEVAVAVEQVSQAMPTMKCPQCLWALRNELLTAGASWKLDEVLPQNPNTYTPAKGRW